MRDPYRLLVVATHPIQYQAPLFRAMAQDPRLDLTVAFCSEFGATSYVDPGFGVEVKWDVPLMEGYKHLTLRNFSPVPNQSTPLGLINPGLIPTIRGGKWDAVWVHGWANVSYWIAMLAAIASGVPLIIRGETHMLSKPTGAKGVIKRAILGALFRRMSGFLAIGSDSADFYRTYGAPEERIHFAPYAVDNEFLFARALELAGQKDELRKKLGLAPELAVVLSVGKMYPGKRPMDLVRAFEQANIADAALVFVGDGSSRQEVEEYVRSKGIRNVVFAGFQNQSALPAFFAMADLFVMTSASETWGLVVNEAMCFSLPVLASDRVTSSHDLVRNGENGYRFKVGDINELGVRLAELLRDPRKRREFGDRSKHIVSAYSLRADVEGVVECLTSIGKRQ